MYPECLQNPCDLPDAASNGDSEDGLNCGLTDSPGELMDDEEEYTYGSYLCCAAHDGKPDVCRELIATAKIGKDDFLRSFISAAHYGRVETVRVFLEHGVDVNAKNEEGMTALMVVSSRGYFWIDSSPSTIGLHMDNNRDTVELLLASGADIEARDENGMTALLLAASFGNHIACPTLIKAGADIEARDKEGMTPLMHSANFGRIGTARVLLELGADVNAKDIQGRTPLMFACDRKCKRFLPFDCDAVDMAKLLLAGGADTEARDNKRKTSYFYAKKDVRPLLRVAAEKSAFEDLLPAAPPRRARYGSL